MSKEMNSKVTEEINDKEVVETSEEKIEVVEISELEKLKLENEELIKTVQELKNDYYKAYADAENTKKRLERDHDLSMKYRKKRIENSILPAIDNLERALSQVETDATKSYREGVKMIYDQILSALKQEGVEPIDALNKEFDPNIHQALFTEEKEGVEPNIVIEELQKGYMIKDRVLRASLVKVSQ